MLQAYRLLAEEMYTKGWDYPLHLGVTEVYLSLGIPHVHLCTHYPQIPLLSHCNCVDPSCAKAQLWYQFVPRQQMWTWSGHRQGLCLFQACVHLGRQAAGTEVGVVTRRLPDAHRRARARTGA
jgi:hypothetical protein